MERRYFNSRIGVILASVGSAVGLGNVWRFPMEAGRGGGAAFILLYLLFVIVLAMPVMCAEFVVGRAGRANAADSFKRLAPGGNWQVAGYMGIIAGFIIFSYYIVVASWTLYYTVESLQGTLLEGHDYEMFFSDFSSSTWHPLMYLVIFLLANTVVVASGVQKGIERCSKWLMPVLFVILLSLALFSLTLPGAARGVRFLLQPDFSRLSAKTVLSAMGQAFFSLSVGIGCLGTYASYFRNEINLVKSSFVICLMDTLVAVVSGFIIFPVVFTIGARVDAGPGLVFISLPHVFNAVFGSVPMVSYVFSGLFYILLLVAALTSAISLQEMVTALVHEKMSLSRRNAAFCVGAASLVCGVACSLSFGIWSDRLFLGMTFFSFCDFITAKFMMPIGGMCFCLFVSRVMKRTAVEGELLGEHPSHFSRVTVSVVYALIRYVAPICLLCVFFFGLLD